MVEVRAVDLSSILSALADLSREVQLLRETLSQGDASTPIRGDVGMELGEHGGARDLSDGDNGSEPERTGSSSSVSWRHPQGRRAARSQYTEVSRRFDYGEETGRRFGQPAALRQDMLMRDPYSPATASYIDISFKRNRRHHDPWGSAPSQHGPAPDAQDHVETTWPERQSLGEIMSRGSVAEQAHLAPLCRRLTLTETLQAGLIKGFFHNGAVSVADVWSDNTRPMANVAFSTQQDVELAEKLVRRGGNRLGIRRCAPLTFTREVAQRRMYLKNYCLVELEKWQIEELAKTYSDGEDVRVVVQMYWDHSSNRQVTADTEDALTDTILAAYIDFPSERHANALAAAVQDQVVRDRGQNLNVLKNIPGIAVPIAFLRDRSYVEPAAAGGP